MLKRLLGNGTLLVLLAMLLTACGGGDDKDDNGGDNDGSQQTPAANGTEVAFLGEAEISGFPMTRIIRAVQDLTLVSYTVVEKDGFLYPMYLVRNDTGETIENVSAIITFLDDENLRLTDASVVSSYVNIPPDKLVPIMGIYSVPVDYDGLATLIVRSGELTFDGYAPYFDAAVTTEPLSDTGEVRGTATNNSGIALVQPVATFVLSDAEGNLISLVQVSPTGLDEHGYWQPGAALELSGTVQVFAGDSLANVAQIDLIVAGYELKPPSRQP